MSHLLLRHYFHSSKRYRQLNRNNRGKLRKEFSKWLCLMIF
jgi:hypothetical protein